MTSSFLKVVEKKMKIHKTSHLSSSGNKKKLLGIIIDANNGLFHLVVFGFFVAVIKEDSQDAI